MSKLDLDAQYDLAFKIQNLIMFVGLLSDEEVEALHELKKQLKESNSTTMAASGTLIPLEKAEHKVARQRAMIKRIDAFIAISESNKDMQDADVELEKTERGQKKIEELFNL